ncbi:MAG TPA: hypothetical protein V6C81_01295 [Planktothrix sp.]|jgi:hypothetical protein
MAFDGVGDSPPNAPQPHHDVTDPNKGFWLELNGVSAHLQSAKDFNRQSWNQKNVGVGLEYEFNRNSAVAGGVYDNSINKTTAYGLYMYTPLHAGPMKFGVEGGIASGYNKTIVPLAAPIAEIEHKHLGANVLFIPPLKNETPPVIGLQLKFKF